MHTANHNMYVISTPRKVRRRLRETQSGKVAFRDGFLEEETQELALMNGSHHACLDLKGLSQYQTLP